jgi:hypothetical protein
MANPTKSEEISALTSLANTHLPTSAPASTQELTDFYAAVCNHMDTTHPDNAYPPVKVRKNA